MKVFERYRWSLWPSWGNLVTCARFIPSPSSLTNLLDRKRSDTIFHGLHAVGLTRYSKGVSGIWSCRERVAWTRLLTVLSLYGAWSFQIGGQVASNPVEQPALTLVVRDWSTLSWKMTTRVLEERRTKAYIATC
jgi:hypothetical protein